MRDRKFFYVLLLTVVLGCAVTLCTGFLTGSLNRLGQVTVTLAGGADRNGDSDASDAAGTEDEAGGAQPQEDGLLRDAASDGNAAAYPGAGAGDENEAAADEDGSGADAAASAAEEGVEAAGKESVMMIGFDASSAGADIKVGPGAESAGTNIIVGPGAEATGADTKVGPGAEATGADTKAGPGASSAATNTKVGPGSESAGTNIKVGPGGAADEGPAEPVTGTADTVSAALIAGETQLQDEAAPLTENAGADADGGASLDENPYYIRLTELDAQIRKNREEQSASNTTGMGGSSLANNTVSNELKLWEGELNTIYNEVLKQLDETHTRELVTAERQWMKNSDAAAVEAAKNSAGGSSESVEYMAAKAESTRARAYELVRLYAAVLTE